MKETIKVIIAFIMFCLIGETVYGQKQESSNLVAFEENGRFGYKNESGKIVIEPHFFVQVFFLKDWHLLQFILKICSIADGDILMKMEKW